MDREKVSFCHDDLLWGISYARKLAREMGNETKINRGSLVIKIIRIILGLFFLITGVLKLFRMEPFIDDIARFDLFPPNWEMWIAYLGIGCELVVGYCLLMRRLYESAVFLAIGMCSVFVGIFVQGWIRGLSLSCNCLGVERAVESYPFEVGWRLVLLLLVLSLFWEIRRGKHYSYTYGRLGLDRDI